MSKRHGMSRSHSESDFTRKAMHVHPKNYLHSNGGPMRGGIRL